MIVIPIAPGEVFDRYTILQLKSERIQDPGKVQTVKREIAQLKPHIAALYTTAKADGNGGRLEALASELKEVNETLWVVEDELRLCEGKSDFGARFVQLARSVYKTNDRRAKIKHIISQMFHAQVYEVKSYA
jgi:hypothetical protein